MTTYRIMAEWSVTGAYYVEADTLEEAVAKVSGEHVPYPSDSTPVAGSFLVRDDGTEAVD